jgi:hypothetical protein
MIDLRVQNNMASTGERHHRAGAGVSPVQPYLRHGFGGSLCGVFSLRDFFVIGAFKRASDAKQAAAFLFLSFPTIPAIRQWFATWLSSWSLGYLLILDTTPARAVYSISWEG